MRKAFRYTLKSLGALALVLACYFGAAVIGAFVPGPSATLSDQNSDAPGTEILLISGAIHYDFLLPLNDQTRARFDFLGAAGYPLAPDAQWLVIGWGAREFYTTAGTYSDITAGAVWSALSGDTSVMRVETAGFLRADLPLTRRTLTVPQYTALLDSIADSFAAPVQKLDHPGFTSTDAFFVANGRFHALRTCNVWVGEMLRRAGLRFGGWTPTPYAVTLSLKLH